MSVSALIADDRILYQQSGVMLPSLLLPSQSCNITLIAVIQIILLKVILKVIIKVLYVVILRICTVLCALTHLTVWMNSLQLRLVILAVAVLMQSWGNPY